MSGNTTEEYAQCGHCGQQMIRDGCPNGCATCVWCGCGLTGYGCPVGLVDFDQPNQHEQPNWQRELIRMRQVLALKEEYDATVFSLERVLRKLDEAGGRTKRQQGES